MPKSKTYTLYLLKSSIRLFDEALTPTALDKVRSGEVSTAESKDIGDGGKLYIFPGMDRPPNWISDINAIFKGVPPVKNRSSCALIIFSSAQRYFVVPFAHAWQYLSDHAIEQDFGLKVTINSIDDKKLKKIESSHLAQAMKGVSQSAFQRDLQSFGLDEALDLVRRITGRSDQDDFANNLTGANSLKITKEMDITEIGDIAQDALVRYGSTRYKATAFHIIDKIRPITDPILLATLDQAAVDEIKAKRDTFELSMPGWSEEDVVYYGFYGPGLRGKFHDLLMVNYVDALGAKLDKLTVESVAERHGVVAEFNNDATPNKSWSIKRALIGSITLNGGLYAISEGDWFRLDDQFKADIDASFRDLIETWANPPERIIKKIAQSGSKTGLESEFEYNTRCASVYGHLCMDQQIIEVPSVPFGRFEACDLLDIANKRLIHVKKSSRQSSVLSHFFKQGGNSARVLKLYPEARLKLVEKVREKYGNQIASDLLSLIRDSMDGWSVEYHVIDAPRAGGNFMIPFFSRITLRDEARSLKGMAFGVSIKFIPI